SDLRLCVRRVHVSHARAVARQDAGTELREIGRLEQLRVVPLDAGAARALHDRVWLGNAAARDEVKTSRLGYATRRCEHNLVDGVPGGVGGSGTRHHETEVVRDFLCDDRATLDVARAGHDLDIARNE